jgi:hypothetical protein
LQFKQSISLVKYDLAACSTMFTSSPFNSKTLDSGIRELHSQIYIPASSFSSLELFSLLLTETYVNSFKKKKAIIQNVSLAVIF